MTFRPRKAVNRKPWILNPGNGWPELIDELLKEYQNPEDLMGEGGILKQWYCCLYDEL